MLRDELFLNGSIIKLDTGTPVFTGAGEQNNFRPRASRLHANEHQNIRSSFYRSESELRFGDMRSDR